MDNFFADLLVSEKPGDLLLEAAQTASKLPAFLRLGAIIPAGPAPYHTGSVLAHLARCMNKTAGDPLAVWMALAHDAGKLTTPATLWPHHYGHEARGARLARTWARKLDLPEPFGVCGALCSRLHMKAGRYLFLRPGKKYRLLLELAASPCAEAFWKVVDADTHSKISLIAKNDWRKIEQFDSGGLNPAAVEQCHLRLLTPQLKVKNESNPGI